jgi:hypothetical protein
MRGTSRPGRRAHPEGITVRVLVASTPTSAVLAISFRIVATRPRVVSRMARIPGTAGWINGIKRLSVSFRGWKPRPARPPGAQE